MSRSMAHYVVLGHYSNSLLADEVNWYLANGYELAGPLAASPGYVRQAVVRSSAVVSPKIMPKRPGSYHNPTKETTNANKEAHDISGSLIITESHDPKISETPHTAKYLQYTPGMMPPVRPLGKAKRATPVGESPKSAPTKANTYNHPTTSIGKRGNWLNLAATYTHVNCISDNPTFIIVYADHSTYEILSHLVELSKLGYTTNDLDDVLKDVERDEMHTSRKTNNKDALSKLCDGMMQRSALWQLFNNTNPDEVPDIGTEGRS